MILINAVRWADAASSRVQQGASNEQMIKSSKQQQREQAVCGAGGARAAEQAFKGAAVCYREPCPCLPSHAEKEPQ